MLHMSCILTRLCAMRGSLNLGTDRLCALPLLCDTGVRRARPDPLMMAGGPGSPGSPGKGEDIDPSFAISLKFNSPADTDYSFGEMTMRTLNTSTAAETVVVRTPSDSLIRDLADFERCVESVWVGATGRGVHVLG